ncbi:MAG: peptide deformylase, partial [Deferribacteraceae bacterium]|nr:peptide deformylase [Deferribacteraceae bacterium]
MAIREVLKYPDAALKAECEDVAALSADICEIIEDMKDTMIAAGHSTGIAAPQIGETVRIVVADASRSRKPCVNHGLLVLINPEIIKYSGSQQSREGCMSVPEYTGNVMRAEKIIVQYMDEAMQSKVIEAEGFEAILLQHEIDHLNGILFVDRVISRRTDLFRRK